MDIVALESTQDFSESFQSPAEFINSAIPSNVDAEQSLKAVKDLLLQLKSSSQAATLRMNAIVDGMLRTAPRLSYEADSLGAHAAALASLANEVQNKERPLAAEGDQAMRAIEVLQKVDERLRLTAQALEDSSSWQDGSEKIRFRNVLEAQNMSDAADALERLECLCLTVQGTAVYDRRRQDIDELRKEFEIRKSQSISSSKAALQVTTGEENEVAPSIANEPSSSIEDTYYSFMKRFSSAIREPSPNRTR
jgi:uncharacterized protein (DUF2342 family)